MQRDYSESGKFSVVLSFAQPLDQEGSDYLKSNAGSIPAYDQLNPPDSPCGDGIPDAYLFDHTGRLVKRDHPARLYDLVAQLVEAVPDPIPPGILGTFQPVELKELAASLVDPQQPALPVINRLEALTRSNDDQAAEARTLIEQVRQWLPGEVVRIEKGSERRPGRSAYLADQFLTRFQGVDRELEEKVKALRKSLFSEADVETFVRARKDLARAESEGDPRKSAQFEKRGRSTLARVVRSKRASSALKSEAQACLEGLEES